MEQIISLEGEIVALRSAAVKAVLHVISELKADGVDRSVLVARLDSLCDQQDDQIARIGRCAAASFTRWDRGTET